MRIADEFCVRFGERVIRIRTGFSVMRAFCRAYLSTDPPDFSVEVTDAEIDAEIAASATRVTREYAEAMCLYRQMAERLPDHGMAVFHGAAIAYEGKAIVFCAPSGVGKSTHISLWRNFLGDDVSVINGDKPILSFHSDGITVCGTPYAGKEGWHRNLSVPLGGVCVIRRRTVNRIRRLSEKEAAIPILRQFYLPTDGDAMEKTMRMADALCRTPVFLLECDISENAFRTSFEALTGKRYGGKKP